METYLREHPELGYKNTSELIKDLLRQWLREQDGNGLSDDAAP